MSTNEKIEFLKKKREYMSNCIEHIIWNIDKPLTFETEQSLRTLQIHINEIKAFCDTKNSNL